MVNSQHLTLEILKHTKLGQDPGAPGICPALSNGCYGTDHV